MACYHPVPAYQEGPGKQARLNPPIGTANLTIPCGGCLGCRTARALEWAHRCMHEASLYRYNQFVTLTYDERNLPSDGSLQPRDLQLFVKRVRKLAASDPALWSPDLHRRVRFFAAGEYGDSTQRPHYHILFFNLCLPDMQRVGSDLYESPALNKLWPQGRHSIGSLTAASANYVAQYSLKKLGCDPDGVVRQPPFMRSSRRPGIGGVWLSAYARDLQHGYLVVDGSPQRVPRAYRKRLKDTAPQLAEQVDHASYLHRIANPSDKNTPPRLAAAEAIHLRRKQLTDTRSL